MVHFNAFEKRPWRLARRLMPALAGLLALLSFVPLAAGQTFGPKTDYSTGGTTYDVATGDMNGDGRVDIVTANYTGNSASVLLGLAGGGFGPKTDYPTGAGALGVALGDVNNDGRLDIATANLGGYNGTTVSVLLGLAGGGFGVKTDYTVGLAPPGHCAGRRKQRRPARYHHGQ